MLITYDILLSGGKLYLTRINNIEEREREKNIESKRERKRLKKRLNERKKRERKRVRERKKRRLRESPSSTYHFHSLLNIHAKTKKEEKSAE